jgi:hypothetical protein
VVNRLHFVLCQKEKESESKVIVILFPFECDCFYVAVHKLGTNILWYREAYILSHFGTPNTPDIDITDLSDSSSF